jgi:hypothetical protein
MFSVFSQNKQVLFGFAETPQTLMLNPGAETNYRFHAGVPLLSGISTNIGTSGLVLTDLFLNDNVNINTKLGNIVNQLDDNDNITFNAQVEVFNGGYRYDDKTYLSFGFYEEVDAMIYFPNDVATLLYEGNNAYLNRSFSLSEILFKADILGVLHAGITRKIDSKLTLGGRFKIYSSSLNLKTTNNSGTFTTNLGADNIYRHHLNNLNINIHTSGITNSDGDVLKDATSLYKDTFFGGNMGVGIDLGFTYRYSSTLEFTGSIIDLGFINYSKDNKTYTVNGDYIFDGLNFQYPDPSNPRDYWGDLNNDFKENVVSEDNDESYTSFRPTKLNLAVKHRFGRTRLNKACYYGEAAYDEQYRSAVGIQLYSIFRPLKNQFAFTTFLEQSIHENLHAKVTYTADEYSFSNFGLGISGQIGKVNLYGIVDNIIELEDIAVANNVSFQIGINLIFN